MRNPLLYVVSGSVLLIVLFAGGCDAGYKEASDIAKLKQMEQEIIDFIGEPKCIDGSECRFIAFGAKP